MLTFWYFKRRESWLWGKISKIVWNIYCVENPCPRLSTIGFWSDKTKKDGILKFDTMLAFSYFNRGESWLSVKINTIVCNICILCRKPMSSPLDRAKNALDIHNLAFARGVLWIYTHAEYGGTFLLGYTTILFPGWSKFNNGSVYSPELLQYLQLFNHCDPYMQ